jgi:hypothetical protein
MQQVLTHPSNTHPFPSGIVLRLVEMAADRLRRALRAVPDDIKTRHALADAYQVGLQAVSNGVDSSALRATTLHHVKSVSCTTQMR